MLLAVGEGGRWAVQAFLETFFVMIFNFLMIEHWRISAVYFTCNQVDEAVKSSRKGDCRIFRLLKIGGTRSAHLPLQPEHRPNFAQLK